jgi:hypothetical protein
LSIGRNLRTKTDQTRIRRYRKRVHQKIKSHLLHASMSSSSWRELRSERVRRDVGKSFIGRTALALKSTSTVSTLIQNPLSINHQCLSCLRAVWWKCLNIKVIPHLPRLFSSLRRASNKLFHFDTDTIRTQIP